MAADLRFRAMGSDAHVIVVGGAEGLIDAARRRIDDLERRWSRFLDDSEVQALNRGAGSFVQVSPDTVMLIGLAIRAWRLSGGAFDPTVLGAVIRAGYDRSFDRLGPTAAAGASPLGLGVTGITIEGSRIRLAAGTGFDPGGIGKGLAADLVCAETMVSGAEGVCVNLGGDVRVTGTGPGGDGWTVAVEHPWVAGPIVLLGLADGAVATSTPLLRRWETATGTGHHLIDPQTGAPSDTDVSLATVVAGEAWMAEVLAKAVVLAGSAHPFDIVGGTGAHALVVDDTGRLASTEGLDAFLNGVALPGRIGASGTRRGALAG